jgi:hypothetical protein
MTQAKVIRLKKTLVMGERAPVWELSLLRPYPPNAGRAEKQPPMTLATPSATISRLALICIPLIPSDLPSLSPLAATDDSKKPRRAIMKALLIAVRTCFMWANWKGQLNENSPLEPTSVGPRISSPLDSQSRCQAKTADRATIKKRSGK